MLGAVFPTSLKGSLIVSCQAPPGDPLDHLETMTRIAVCVARGGAGGLRANGAEYVAAFCKAAALPVIGIQKRKIDSQVSITHDFPSAAAIATAGADIIALDCSKARHPRADPWREMIARIHDELSKPVLADIATLDEAIAAESAGADAVATTLYGFTPETEGSRSVNWEMVDKLTKTLQVPVIVEGHISEPHEARKALEFGAYAIVVGSAITRPDSITAKFANALLG